MPHLLIVPVPMDLWGCFLQTATCNLIRTRHLTSTWDLWYSCFYSRSKQAAPLLPPDLNVRVTADSTLPLSRLNFQTLLAHPQWAHHPSVHQQTLSPLPSEMCAKCMKNIFAPETHPSATPTITHSSYPAAMSPSEKLSLVTHVILCTFFYFLHSPNPFHNNQFLV